MRTVLFVCQFNSARSQLAEALARSMAPDGVRILSAGLARTVVNAEVLKALGEIGLDASSQRSKSLEEVAGEKVDDVVILAEEAAAPVRRAFPEARHHLLPLPDPVAAQDPRELPAEVRRVRDRIQAFLASWLHAGDAP